MKSYLIWRPVFEGENTPPADANKSFTQEQVNAMLANERKKADGQINKMASELEALKSRSNLTDQEREELESRIAAINNESKSKEEQAKLALANERKKWETENKTLSEKMNAVDRKYRNHRIESDLVSAAAAAKAFNPRTVVTVLRDMTELADELGEDGKPTGNEIVKVKMKTKGADNKPVTLELSPQEAVKRLTEDAEYQFMFQSSATGGSGNNNRGGGQQPEGMELVSNIETFKKYREDINSGRIK